MRYPLEKQYPWKKVYFVTCPRRNPAKLLINLFQSLRIFLKEKPSYVVSTGADTAIVLHPANSTDFFATKVREVIAMPR